MKLIFPWCQFISSQFWNERYENLIEGSITLHIKLFLLWNRIKGESKMEYLSTMLIGRHSCRICYPHWHLNDGMIPFRCHSKCSRQSRSICARTLFFFSEGDRAHNQRCRKEGPKTGMGVSPDEFTNTITLRSGLRSLFLDKCNFNKVVVISQCS